MLRFEPYYGNTGEVAYLNPAYIISIEKDATDGAVTIYMIDNKEAYVKGDLEEIADRVGDYLRPLPSVPKAPALEI